MIIARKKYKTRRNISESQQVFTFEYAGGVGQLNQDNITIVEFLRAGSYSMLVEVENEPTVAFKGVPESKEFQIAVSVWSLDSYIFIKNAKNHQEVGVRVYKEAFESLVFDKKKKVITGSDFDKEFDDEEHGLYFQRYFIKKHKTFV